MKYTTLNLNNVRIEIASFIKNGVEESHLFIKSNSEDLFEGQVKSILTAIERYMYDSQTPDEALIFTRYFVSDYANQQDSLELLQQRSNQLFKNCAISIVQQPPLNNVKITAWAYIIHETGQKQTMKTVKSQSETIIKRGKYKHLWATQLTTANGSTNPYDQTNNIFTTFDDTLSKHDLTLKNNCLRTWLFVKDIDYNYPPIVKARRKLFEDHNMTKDTHFIASTGIEGRHANPKVNLLMDAYAVGGIKSEQIQFLQAKDYLNPTHEYGVTFERGTSLEYGDRKHIFISGTASINNKGEVVHEKDVKKQIERTMSNIAALLDDAEATMDDIAQMIVYLRDGSDAEPINDYFFYNYREIPKVVVLAPVCRPGWLVEVECIAIKDHLNPEYTPF